jgi:two-component system response regulator HydG
MKRARVMIVDDDRDLAESLAELIEVRGHKVEIASNGREAVERFRQQDYDIAFMDVRMPVMNGVESFLEIRKLRPDAKIVMMTGFKEPMVQKALEQGALGLLHKPFSVEDLLEKLSDATQPLVLVVDDDVDFAEGLSEVLTHHGYKTALAGTGPDAVRRVEAGGIDVLILDLRLPVMDGLEVYRTLKAKGNTPPTIIVTASLESNRDSIAALESMAVKECFAKPVDPNQLMSTIDRILVDAA